MFDLSPTFSLTSSLSWELIARQVHVHSSLCPFIYLIRMTSPLLNVRETMLCSSSLSRLSHSDYGSLSSSDDEVSCYNNLNSQMSHQNIGETHPGICPHCKKIYESRKDSTNMFPDDDSQNSPRIRECSIAVVGARGVGKTSITRVQYGNDILFTDILCKHGEAEINNTFMIDIVDGNNSNASLLHAQGFVLMYSVTDRDSFYEAAEIFKTIEESRGETVSCVLVGSKCDLQKKRRVEAYEGQALARCIGCPFLEVSARKNDCVNEAFLELMRIVERKRISKLKQLQ
uniref:small monomeric GTPase n=1 Tax=Heterorhabditis bacteriophora TaxID=37862 RepID=A0A1I7WIW9_HETBA